MEGLRAKWNVLSFFPKQQQMVLLSNSLDQLDTCYLVIQMPFVPGDGLFDKVIKDQETLNIDMVWEVIDWYKQATLRTR